MNNLKQKPVHDIIIFDVDGVLIDTSRSFSEVVARAVRWAWTVHLGRKGAEKSFTERHFALTKTHPAFNDDYDLAWAAACCVAASSSGKCTLSESLPSPEDWRFMLDGCSDMDVPSWVKRTFGELVERDVIRRVCDELYFGTEQSDEGGLLPSPVKGLQENETPMISMHWSSLPVPSGIYTGRSAKELSPALERIGWQDFPQRMIITSDSGITKPSPLGLKILCDATGASNPLFLGDTQSDRQTVQSFGRGEFAAIGSFLQDERNRYATTEEALRRYRMI